jgi:transmembrane sensor
MTTERFIDFLTTHRFKEWVLNPDDKALKAFWEQWLAENTAHAEEIERFKNLILTMHQPSAFDETAENTLWNNIQNTLSETTEPSDTIVELHASKTWYRSWMGMAAGLALLLSAAFFLFYFNSDKTLSAQTAYGETRSVILPDGSEVVLNAHSEIRFNKNWKVGEDREVSLTGEAYFIVNEQGDKTHRDRFIVHTPDLDVEVLGTRFNVNTYRPQTQVVLQKGSVEIKTSINNKVKKYSLAPEQRAIFNREQDKVEIAQVNSNTLVGWKDKRFIFDNTPLSEVAIMLENTYGFKVIIEKDELKNKLISGEIPISEKKSLLLALSTLYALKINEQNKDTLYISK